VELFDLPPARGATGTRAVEGAPLADRMRPRSLDEVVGQEHLLGPGRVLRVNVALVGVLFEETSRLRLTWTAGYGLAGDCASQDRELMAQGIAAASQIPY